jgi:hypothetical protein
MNTRSPKRSPRFFSKPLLVLPTILSPFHSKKIQASRVPTSPWDNESKSCSDSPVRSKPHGHHDEFHRRPNRMCYLQRERFYSLDSFSENDFPEHPSRTLQSDASDIGNFPTLPLLENSPLPSLIKLQQSIEIERVGIKKGAHRTSRDCRQETTKQKSMKIAMHDDLKLLTTLELTHPPLVCENGGCKMHKTPGKVYPQLRINKGMVDVIFVRDLSLPFKLSATTNTIADFPQEKEEKKHWKKIQMH